MATYRIISCNVRLDTPNDGEQQFIYRADNLCKRLMELDADVIGFQEVTHKMRPWLIERMPGYAFVGAGREQDRLGEGSLIAYKQSKFILERLVSDVLSPTPHIPGTTYGADQSKCPRIFSSADLMPLEGGTPLRLMNIHTDHLGVNARMLEVDQLMASFSEQNALRPMPTVLTGDFNATPDAPEIVKISTGGIFTDVTADIEGTFHDFGRLNESAKIDYVFVTHDIKCTAAFAVHEICDGLYLSDHDPVVADITVH